MGKYSDFERVEKDFYPTIDPAAVPDSFRKEVFCYSYAEPCYGEGDLERLLSGMMCMWRSDIRETTENCIVKDALQVTWEDVKYCDRIITNPPYTKSDLLPLIDHFITLKPTWLLLPGDFMHNIYAGPYMKKCSKVISVGRLYWQKNKQRGKNNFCWYLFETGASNTVFVGR